MKYFFLTLCMLTSVPASAQQYLYRYFDKKWGVTNEKKEIVVAPAYDSIKLNMYPYIALSKGDKWGVASAKGKIIIPCKYSDITIVHRNIAVTKNQAICLSTGKVSPVFCQINGVSYNNDALLIIVKNTQQKTGVYNLQTGKLQLDYKYDEAEFLKDTTTPLLKVYTTDGYGLINGLTGKVILPAGFSKLELRWDYNTPLISAKTKDNKDEFYDLKGTAVVVKHTYQLQSVPGIIADIVPAAIDTKVRLVRFEKTGNEKWNLWQDGMNNKKVAIAGYSELVSLYSDYHVMAKTGDKCGIINYDGKIIIPVAYDKICFAQTNVPDAMSTMYYQTERNQLSGLLSRYSLKEIRKPMFADVRIVKENVGVALPGGKKIDIYTSSELSLEMAQVVMPDGRKGFMHLSNGKVFIPGVE